MASSSNSLTYFSRRLFAVLVVGAMGAGACVDDVHFTPQDTFDVAEVTPAPGGGRRLLARQYTATIRHLLGSAAAEATSPPPDYALSGFDAIGASELALSDQQVEQYEASAMAVANAFVADVPQYEALRPCTPSGPDDEPCMRGLVQTAGRLLWRRPLSPYELSSVTIFGIEAASALNNFDQGAVFAIGHLLQSPHFIYQIELGKPLADEPQRRRLNAYEFAARLSFTLLDRGPDAALLDMAAGGALESEEDVRAVAASMLQNPDAEAALGAFFGEAWRLRDLPEIAKDTDQYPAWTPTLAIDAEQEIQRLVSHLVWERDGDFLEILTADYAFVSNELATLYGVAPPSPGEWIKVTLPPEQGRSGLLGSAAFLARMSHPGETSPTRRGLFMQDRLRCNPIPPPPPDVDASLPEQELGEELTKKELLAITHAEPACASCHHRIDPLGLAVETFDPIGRYRATEYGKAIDTSGEVAELGSFADSQDIGALLAADPRVAACIVSQLYRDAVGHIETPGEQPFVDHLVARFAADERRISNLLIELVSNPAFRLVGEPK